MGIPQTVPIHGPPGTYTHVWLLCRKPPANEIIGAYTSKELAEQAAGELESDIDWQLVDGTYRAGLWQLFSLPLEGGPVGKDLQREFN